MKKILITEDDPLMAEIYRDNFDAEGFSAEIAPDGIIALQRLKQNPPDLVLLDLMLPKLNGVEVLKFIRSHDQTRHLPVIVMSNAFATELGQQATEAGATRCLAKNAYGPRKLLQEIRNTLATAAPPTETANSLKPAAPAAAVLVPNPPSADIPKPPLIAVPARPVTPAPAPVSVDSDDFQAARGKLRAIAQQIPGRINQLRELMLKLGRNPATQPQTLLEMHQVTHGIAGAAAFGNLRAVAQLSCALETLLNDLHARPQKLNPSSLRTLAQAVDLLDPLYFKTCATPEEMQLTPLILVLDDEPISRETTCTALEHARLRAVSTGSAEIALHLLRETRFDLIFLDVQMPGMDGFQVCKKIHETGLNTQTPVVFLTSLSDFESRTRSMLSGGVDFISKPVVLIELAVKALTHLLRTHCRPQT